ncbi:hypothetical protein JHK87_023816 [Glycine soja]|nr:hypothetical protein JHK87_023816 [Glycine soja]
MGVGRDIDDLPKNNANHTALTPLWFLERAALVHPTRTSVVHGSRHYTWHQTYQRCRRFASALSKHSIGLGHTVAVIAPNIPAIYEAHFGIPMAGAVLNTINIRLNAPAIAFLLAHSSAVAVIVDQEFFTVAEESLKIWSEKSKSFKPPILIVIVNASPEEAILPLPHVVHVNTAGAAPPPSVIGAMSERGFRVTHTYGLSETYGPSTICAWKPEWESLPIEQRSRLSARQGVRYLKNRKANMEAFADGWFHSGDLAVKHPDGYIEIKDRSKDIIISGGENISSVEVENVLFSHPAVLEASVVARPDEKWGESPCAFVTLKPAGVDGAASTNEKILAEDIVKFCRSKMPAYWVPKSVVFGPLPKTATGKTQKQLLRTKAKEMGPVRKSKL